MTDQFLSLLPLINRRARAMYRKGKFLDHDDLAQAAALRLWKEMPKYDPAQGASLETWATMVAHAAMIDAIRKHGCMFGGGRIMGARERHRQPLQDFHRTEDGGARRREITDTFHARLKGLSERSRLICVLRFREGMTQEEIAASIGISGPTVCQELKRLTAQLKATA